MYWTNFRQPTAHVHQNIFGKTIIEVCDKILAWRIPTCYDKSLAWRNTKCFDKILARRKSWNFEVLESLESIEKVWKSLEKIVLTRGLGLNCFSVLFAKKRKTEKVKPTCCFWERIGFHLSQSQNRVHHRK